MNEQYRQQGERSRGRQESYPRPGQDNRWGRGPDETYRHAGPSGDDAYGGDRGGGIEDGPRYDESPYRVGQDAYGPRGFGGDTGVYGRGSSPGFAGDWQSGQTRWQGGDGQVSQGSDWRARGQRDGAAFGRSSRGSSYAAWQDTDEMKGTTERQGGWQGQSFAGKGPKDCQRSDERLREEISDRMTDDHDLDASEISVQVQAGEVTLSGTVRDRDQKRRAEDLAERCSGVKDVRNNIRVARDNGSNDAARGSDSGAALSGTTSSSKSGSRSSASGSPAS